MINDFSAKYGTFNQALTKALNDLGARQVITQGATVAALAQTISGTYTQAEVQAISTKVDLIITRLKSTGVIASS